MLLSDWEILELVNEKPDFITDFVAQKTATERLPSFGLEPHGYTFRLHPTFVWYRPRFRQGAPSLMDDRDTEIIELKEGDSFPLPPYHLLLVSSLETFSLPSDIVGLLFGKTTYTKQGLFYNLTVVDAGFTGRLSFCVVNLNPAREIEIFPYGGIAQIMFVRANSAKIPYVPREELLTAFLVSV